jgi:hypothetical protein
MAVRYGLSSNSERVLRFANQIATTAHGRFSIIHAVQGGDPDLPIQLDLADQFHAVERQEASRRIADLQRIVGSDAPVRIAVGPIKEALLEAARRSDASTSPNPPRNPQNT